VLLAGALPVVPGATCPPAVGALGAAGLGPICQATSGATGAVASAASQLAGFGVGSVLDALGSWVSAGAVWLLAQIGTVVGSTTGIDLGARWFTSHYETMAALAGVVIVPLLLLGIVQSIYRQDASMLLRSVLVNVPLAILLTAVAVELVQLGLAATDAMSAAVAHGAGLDTGHFMAAVASGLSGPAAAGQPGVPAFVVFLGGVAVVLGAVMVWVELLIRAAAVYVAVLFLPLALASLAWPAIAHWCRRLVDTLVALVLGKFVIVSVLSLAAGALAAGTGSSPSGAAGSDGGGGFAAVLGGAALLLLAAFAPWALFRLLPFLEAGAVAHLDGLGHRARQSASGPVRGLAQIAMRSSAAGSFAGAAAGSLGAGTGGPGGAGGGGPMAGGPTGPAGPAHGGAGPDLGPSSVGSSGVGTTDAPGHGIPMWSVHPGATAAARSGLGGGPSEGMGGPDTVAPAPESAAASLTLLPRQTGALRSDALGRDELGIRLVAASTAPGPDGGSATRDSGGGRDL
jgi:hypothetical protein